jgi:hypothetical protein
MPVNSQLLDAPFGADSRNPFSYVKIEQIARDSLTAWLTLDEITQQLNLFNDESQDSYLRSLEVAVRQAIEDYLGLSIFSVTYRVWYGAENLASSPVSLDLPEVSQNYYPNMAGVTINKVAYYNEAMPPVLTTVATNQYFYDPSGNKVIIQSLPTSINSEMTAPIVCEYQTAPNPISAYPVIKQAGLLLLTNFYNNRALTGDTVGEKAEIPFGLTTLLRPYKPLVM